MFGYGNGMQGQRPSLGYSSGNSFDNTFGGSTYQPPAPYGRPTNYANRYDNAGGGRVGLGPGEIRSVSGVAPPNFHLPNYGNRPQVSIGYKPSRPIGGGSQLPYVHPSQYQDPNAWYGPGSPYGINPPQFQPDPPIRSLRMGGGGGIPNMFNNRNFFNRQQPNQGGPFVPTPLPGMPTPPVPGGGNPRIAGQPIPGRKKQPNGTIPGYPNVPFDPPRPTM